MDSLSENLPPAIQREFGFEKSAISNLHPLHTHNINKCFVLSGLIIYLNKELKTKESAVILA